MDSSSIPIGTIHGIKIRIHWSWAIVFVLLTWSLAEGYFPSIYGSWSQTEYWVVAAVASLLLFVSVLLHELGHSLVAQSEGLPVTSITLFIFGGVSNLSREPSSPGDEFRIAFAGPAVSIVIGVVCVLLHNAITDPTWLTAIFGYLGVTNLLLAAFNLLPAYPLDGGRVLHSMIWAITHNSVVATRWASTIGEGFGWLFILGGLWLVFAGDLVNGIWLAMIGWLLQTTASNYRHAPNTNDLQALTVRDVMSRNVDAVPPDTDLADAVYDYLLRSGQQALPVGPDGRLLGVLSMTDVQHFLQAQWPTVPVSRAMTPATRVETVPSTMSATDALRLMTAHRRHELPVVDNDRLVGLVSQAGIMRYFQMRNALGLGTTNSSGASVTPRSA